MTEKTGWSIQINPEQSITFEEKKGISVEDECQHKLGREGILLPFGENDASKITTYRQCKKCGEFYR